MYVENIVTKRFIIALIAGSIVAILLGWVVGIALQPHMTAAESVRTPQDIANTLKTYNNGLPEEQQLGTDFTVGKIKHEYKWWYLVTVNYKQFSTHAILADFNDTPESLQVIVAPNSTLPEYNISSVNIPYDMIETIDKEQGVQL